MTRRVDDDYTAFERELRDPIDRANPDWHPSLIAHPAFANRFPSVCGECGTERGPNRECACDPDDFAPGVVADFRRRVRRHKPDWNVA